MTIESLLTKMIDTGIENDTLLSVLNSFFETGNINVRRLCLPTDKKVKNSETINQVDIFNKEAIIFKTIINKLDEISVDRLNEFGINNTIILKLKSLSDEQLKSYIGRQVIPNNDRSLADVLALIYGMSRVNDMYGSQKKSIFETMQQETQYKKRVKNPEQYTKRIYLNIPLNKVGIEFLTLFKLKCIEKGLPSKMKGMGSSGYDEGDLDTTIIYSNDYYLLEHVNIIENLIHTRPDLFKNFGTPVISGARVKSNDGECYYTISSGLLNDNTSNGYYNELYKISFAILCSKYNNATDLNIELINYYSNMKNSELNSLIANQKNILRVNIKNNNVSNEKMVEDYKNIIKIVSSYLRFGDVNHLDIPLYQDEIFTQFIKDNTAKQKHNLSDNSMEKNMYLYNTEELINEVLELYDCGDVSFYKLIENYLSRINLIYKMFKYYALREPSFVTSERYQTVINIFNQLPIKEYHKEINDTQIDKLEYYQYVQEQINIYLNNNKDHVRK